MAGLPSPKVQIVVEPSHFNPSIRTLAPLSIPADAKERIVTEITGPEIAWFSLALTAVVRSPDRSRPSSPVEGEDGSSRA